MRKWLPLIVIVGTLVFTAAVFDRLPERMVTHWNAAGEPDGYGSRFMGAFLLPLVVLGMWGLMLVLPKLDPRQANIEKFRGSYEALMLAVVAVMCALHVSILGTALGWPIEVHRAAPILIGALFIVLGNLLPRFRSNFFFGIRTPWTLSSETAWLRTHRLGGWVMGGLGLALVLTGVLGRSEWIRVLVGGTVVLVVSVMANSYFVWRSEQRR
ncbi:partial Immunity protein SdpI, partial [Anaerolineae bacterium]